MLAHHLVDRSSWPSPRGHDASRRGLPGSPPRPKPAWRAGDTNSCSACAHPRPLATECAASATSATDRAIEEQSWTPGVAYVGPCRTEAFLRLDHHPMSHEPRGNHVPGPSPAKSAREPPPVVVLFREKGAGMTQLLHDGELPDPTGHDFDEQRMLACLPSPICSGDAIDFVAASSTFRPPCHACASSQIPSPAERGSRTSRASPEHLPAHHSRFAQPKASRLGEPRAGRAPFGLLGPPTGRAGEPPVSGWAVAVRGRPVPPRAEGQRRGEPPIIARWRHASMNGFSGFGDVRLARIVDALPRKRQDFSLHSAETTTGIVVRATWSLVDSFEKQTRLFRCSTPSRAGGWRPECSRTAIRSVLGPLALQWMDTAFWRRSFRGPASTVNL